MRFTILIATLLLSVVAQARSIVLEEKNTVVIRDEITAVSMAEAQNALLELDIQRGRANYPIYLVLDSPGGSIMAGEMFIQYAKTVKNLKTISIFAASMASAIVEALEGERLVTENATLMFHRAAGAIDGHFEDGEMESRLWFYKAMVRSMEQRNASRLNMSIDVYKAKVMTELWLYGPAIVKNNAADATVDISCTQELSKSTTINYLRTFFGAIAIENSKCPLFRVGKAANPKERYLLELHLKGLKSIKKEENNEKSNKIN